MGQFSTSLKKEFRDKVGSGFFFVFRQLERCLPVLIFYSLLKPIFWIRTILNTLFKSPVKVDFSVPAFLQTAGIPAVLRRQRTDFYLNHVILCFPDRLPAAKWMNGCEIEGLEHLRLARQNGRPVVLAFCHFGPFYLLGSWLRAAAMPVATLIGKKTDRDTQVRELKNRYSPFQQFPTAFYGEQLRELNEFLAGGNQLAIAIDVPIGNQMLLPFDADCSFQMSTGAVRLAIRHEAELIACSLIDLGGWRFKIKLGRPVPREFLTKDADHTLAGNYLLNDMMPVFKAFPEQCTVHLTRCLQPNPAVITAVKS